MTSTIRPEVAEVCTAIRCCGRLSVPEIRELVRAVTNAYEGDSLWDYATLIVVIDRERTAAVQVARIVS